MPILPSFLLQMIVFQNQVLPWTVLVLERESHSNALEKALSYPGFYVDGIKLLSTWVAITSTDESNYGYHPFLEETSCSICLPSSY